MVWFKPIKLKTGLPHYCARNSIGPLSQENFRIHGKTGNTAKAVAFTIAVRAESGTATPSSGTLR